MKVIKIALVAGLVLLGNLSAVIFVQAATGDPAKGKSLYPVCTACHGVNGAGNQAMGAPKISGQLAFYTLKQLQLFQSGARGTAAGDTKGMQMAAMSKGPQLKSEQALANLVAYVSSLPDTPIAATISGDVNKGRVAYPVCAACHGVQGEGNEAMAGPRLTGQSDWYLVAQLKKFKSGQRGYHNSDHGGRQMRAMTATLVNDQAINDVVAYINSLN
ncbi:MAG: c-type cytochrome [Pseudomonadales bacterium]|jgi:cytochrome c oxidase subunit 2|nr:c-type cytochrome [Pseudomonadales bacterium]